MKKKKVSRLVLAFWKEEGDAHLWFFFKFRVLLFLLRGCKQQHLKLGESTAQAKSY